MSQTDDGYTRVERPNEVDELLAAMMEPGGASLQMLESGGKPEPVLMVSQAPGYALTLDISATRELAVTLRQERPFRVLGQVHGKMVRTPALTARSCQEDDGRLLCISDYPRYLEVLQRRSSFRAHLRLGMEVGGILRDDRGHSAQGDLKDLSLEGCQLELPLAAGRMLAEASQPMEVELCFPDNTRFLARAEPRHRQVDTERQSLQVGFQFKGTSPDQERQLWHLVREIEREAARYDEGGEASRLPSLLFQASTTAAPGIGRRNAQEYATPMAKRLARIAGYLDAQMLELQQGGAIDSVQLSRHADRLLLLNDEDREGLLFATRCLPHEPRLVRHCLAVAVQLLNLAGLDAIPRELCKAMVACAMIHDLGKALLPAALLETERLDAIDYARLQQHVTLLLERTTRCHWLSRSVLASVVEDINERLDGSGYPRGLEGEALHELARAAAVVDVVEAMRRERPDRPAFPIDEVYRVLLSQPERFDQKWVRRYIRRFGLYPVGALVKFESGKMGWVQGLDAQGRPNRLQLTESVHPPGRGLGEVIQGDISRRLGRIEGEIPVST
ncbi:MAG: HD domain-containing phosphohydrolase [Halomonas sp.]